MSTPWRYRRPDVLRQLPAGHAVIEASAGTGKTYTLEHLVVDLLLQGVPIGKILVVTFTEKAANELRTRVRALLERLLDPRDADRAPDSVPEAECWLLGPAEQDRLGHALREYDSASISTIHSFCQQILTENAFANHRLFQEELADGRELFSQAFADTLRTRFATDPDLREHLVLWRESASIEALEGLLWQCSQRQGEVVPSFDRPRVLAIAQGLGRRSEALSNLPLLNARTRERMGASIEAIWGALESFKADEGGLGGYRKLRGVFAETGTKSIRRALDYALKCFSSGAEKHPCLVPYRDGLEALQAGIPDPRALVAARFVTELQQVLAERKRGLGRFDFQDLLTLVEESLRGPRAEVLLGVLRERFSHALIDEFQDTDAVQWSVFKRVFADSKDHRLFLVGDPKQAIYGFRGADVHTYLEARRELVGQGEPVALTRNFRSTAGLVAAYNRVFEDFFTGEIGYPNPVTCGRPELAFHDPGGLAPIHVLVTGTKNVGKRAVYPRLGPAIAREIRRLVGKATFDGKVLEHRNIYVLGRGAGDLVEVAEHLRQTGVPFAFYKQEGLFQSREAQALEDLLDALCDPRDRAKRVRAWMTPFFGVPLADLGRAGEVADDEPLMRRLLDWSRLAGKREYERLFTALLQDSGLVRRLLLFESGERSLTNFLHLVEVLRESFGVRQAPAEELVQGLRSWRQGTRQPPGQNGNLQRLETDRDAVQLLTMHMSKGLEAPVVFVVGGLFRPDVQDAVRSLHWPPQGWPRRRLNLVGSIPREYVEQARVESEEEDQRLLYVALTRAKGRLYLPFAGEKAFGGFQSAERVNGCYQRVNARLQRLLAETPERPKPGALFSFEILGRERVGVPGAPAPLPPGALDAGLLQTPSDPGLDALRSRHAGFTTTSFSALRGRAGPVTTPEEGAEEKAEAHDRAPPADDELPGGAATGSFLHEVLARLDPRTLLASEDPETLAKDPDAARLFAGWARRFGVSKQHHAHAWRLLHTAYRAPLDLGDDGPLDGLASAPRLLREMDFLFPIPEASHPRLGEALSRGGPPRLRVERGFVVGFVDLLFEHRGRTYFADWKSNCLPAFDPAHVDAEVEADYALQGRLYTLAMVKLLGIRDEDGYQRLFGGYLFLFLRGLRAEGGGREGVHFRRPSWREVLAWEEELLQTDFGKEASP